MDKIVRKLGGGGSFQNILVHLGTSYPPEGHSIHTLIPSVSKSQQAQTISPHHYQGHTHNDTVFPAQFIYQGSILSRAHFTNRCGSVPFPTSVVQSVRVQAMTRAGSAHLYSTRELSQYRNNAILDLTPRVERGGGRGEERMLPIRAIEVERSPSESNTPHSKLPST